MSSTVAPTPGMRILARDAEWLVTWVDPSDYSHQHYAVHCVGADDLVRGHEAIFLTQLDDIKGFFLMRFKEDVRDDASENLTDRMLVPLAQTTVDATADEERMSLCALGHS